MDKPAVTDVAKGVAAMIAGTLAFLKRYPPFDAMDDASLRFIAQYLTLAYFPQGSVVLSPQAGLLENLYIVQRGLVQLQPAEGFHVSDGGVVTLGPGECFSVYALMEKRAVASPYTAAEDTFCYLLPAEIFTELLHHSARFREYSTDYLRSLLRESRRLIQMHGAGAAAEQHAMNRPLRELAKREPIACRAQTPLHEALRAMSEARVGSIIIVDERKKPIGIFTRHDVLERVALAGRALTESMQTVMTPQPACLEAHASVYDAALLIATRGIRHVPITENGALAGVVTERDLFAAQRVSVRSVNRVIVESNDGPALAQAGREVQALVRSLFSQGVAAEQLTRLITTLNDALTARAIAVTARQHDLQGIRWCWLAFGSEGRQEQTVSTDQDNGIIFTTDGALDDEQAQARLLPFAQVVNQLLDRCGFPLCVGDIMAGNPRWCLSESEWRSRFADWVRNTDPEALLNSVIFFDFRALAGDAALAQGLRAYLNDLVKTNARFLRQLAQEALTVKPPLGLISDFVTETDADGQAFIDLKKSGARLFVDAARVFALAAGVDETHSAARLRAAAAALKLDAAEVASAIDGFLFIQQLRLRAQLADGARDHAQANRVVPAALSEIDRRILKESLRQARKLQSRLALDFQL